MRKGRVPYVSLGPGRKMNEDTDKKQEEAESRAAESILVPDAIVQHQMPSPVVDEELGSSMVGVSWSWVKNEGNH
jgi:hypothetical protein